MKSRTLLSESEFLGIVKECVDTLLSEYKAYYKKPNVNSNAPKKIAIIQGYRPNVDPKNPSKERPFIFVIGGAGVGNDQVLCDAINSVGIPSQLLKAVPKGNDNKVMLVISPSFKNEIPNYTAKIGAAIKGLGIYDEDSVDKFVDNIFDSADSFADDEDQSNAAKVSIENWKDVLKTLNDPKTRLALLRYQTTDVCDDKFGHKLSPKNVYDILAQFPNASWVCEKRTWANSYNRTIAPNATPIIVNKAVDPVDPPIWFLDKISKDLYNGKTFKEVMKETHYAKQVVHGITIKAQKFYRNYMNKNRKPIEPMLFVPTKMYDVSQTIPPKDPKDDVWTNQIGLMNNLNGAMNTAALDFANIKPTQSGSALSNASLASQKNRKQGLERICKIKGVDISDLANASNDEFISEAAYRYSMKVLPEYGFIKQDEQDKIAVCITMIICYAYECKLPQKFVNFVGIANPSDKEAFTAHTIMGDIIPSMNMNYKIKD